MKKLALLMGVIFGVASCVKEASGPSLEMENSIKTVSFSFNVKPQADIETRSIDIGTYQDDDRYGFLRCVLPLPFVSPNQKQTPNNVQPQKRLRTHYAFSVHPE